MWNMIKPTITAEAWTVKLSESVRTVDARVIFLASVYYFSHPTGLPMTTISVDVRVGKWTIQSLR